MRVHLGNIHVDAQLSGLGHVEQFALRTARAAGINQLSDIRVTGGDHAIKGRVDFLKGREFFQTAEIRLR